MAGVVELPVVGDDALFVGDPPMKGRPGVRRHDVERRRLEAVRDAPLDRAVEDIGPVVVEAEHEAAVHHHAEIVATSDHLVVVAAQVLPLVVAAQVLRVEGLEADEHAAHAGGRGSFDQVAAQDRLHRARPLEQSPHAPHAFEQGTREPLVAEQVVVEEVEVLAGKTVDLRERLVDGLRVERAAALVERVLVAEVAVVGQPRDTTIEFGQR